MRNYYIGIDMGTSALKVILVDERCKIVGMESEAYTLEEPQPGWKEIDPQQWFEAAMRALKRLLKPIDGGAVRAINFTGQMHTLTMLDEDGKTLRRSIQWNDGRTRALIPEVKRAVAEFERASAIGNIISTGSPAVNLYWMKREEPDQFRRIHKILMGHSYLVYRFSGRCTADYCEASVSSLYDLENQCWSEEMRSWLGLRQEQYPDILGSAEIAGVIRPELSRELGLGEQVKILAGTGDNPAAFISMGGLKYGTPVISLGTAGVLTILRKQVDFKEKGKNILFSVDGKQILTLAQGVIESCGGTLNWWVHKILQEDKRYLREIEAKMEECWEGSTRLLFYPHITGEKTLHKNLDLRGALLGISGTTSKEEICCAQMTGICMAFRELLDNMAPQWQKSGNVKITGGGSNSGFWVQTMANMLNVSIERRSFTGGAAFGMALLAAQADGQGETWESAERERSLVIQPDIFRRDICDEMYARYLKLYPMLEALYGEGTSAVKKVYRIKSNTR